MSQIIDGKLVSKQVRQRVKEETEKLKAKGITPGLAVIIVGDDPASQVYVKNKEKACDEVGFYSEKYALPENTTQEELNNLVKNLTIKRKSAAFCANFRFRSILMIKRLSILLTLLRMLTHFIP
mgnify:CR=1 FL=1